MFNITYRQVDLSGIEYSGTIVNKKGTIEDVLNYLLEHSKQFNTYTQLSMYVEREDKNVGSK